MDELISPNQSSFISSRQWANNIIIAQELIHSMQNMKYAKGFMAIKIDLKNAYDRVNREFLLDTFSNIGI